MKSSRLPARGFPGQGIGIPFLHRSWQWEYQLSEALALSLMFPLASESITTPIMIREQAMILTVVMVSPRRITPQTILVMGSKVVRIAAVEAPTYLMPIWSRERATTVQSREKAREIP